MAVFTFLFEGGKSLPFGIGENAVLLTGILVLMQLVVMLLGVDTLIDGVSDLIKLEPGAETIVALSCIMSAISAMVMIYTGDVHNGLPFSVVSAFSLAFAMHGRKMYRLAMKDSLRDGRGRYHPLTG